MMSTNILIKLPTAAILCAAVIGSQFIEKAELKAQSIKASEKQIERDEEQLSAHLSFLKHSPSLGFDNLIANATFVQFLQYFGDEEARKQFGYVKSPKFFETITSRDPNYRNFYIFLSGSSTLYAGQPQKTVDLMASGLAKLSPNQPPDSYYIWRYKAVDELLFLGDNEAAQKSFSSAAKWADQSTDPGAEYTSKRSQKTASFLAEDPDSKTAQIDAWSSLLTTAMDKNTRDRAVERIQSLGGNVVFSEDGGISIQYNEIETSAETTSVPDT